MRELQYPFGFGPRVYIGQGLATLETAVAIEKMVSAFAPTDR